MVSSNMKATVVSPIPGKGRPESVADGDEGIGGLNKSKDAGELVARDPAEQRQPVPRVNFRRAP